MLAPGAHLGPFELIGLIGEGGMGQVYKARDTRLDRIVAVKVLAPALAGDSEFRKRFDREARAISQLDHPHICALHDVGEHEGTAFLVIQYLEGETLAARLQRGALKLDEALTVAAQIAAALAAAHRAGIAHRDLKPGNVMLTRPGAKLLDFGLAKATAAGANSGSRMSNIPTQDPLTAEGTILGTFQYMAPEQLEGKDADGRADIFAFGAILYEMITGRRAFAGKSQASLIAAIMSAEPPAISTFQSLAPPALNHIVRSCLEKDPDKRLQSAQDLLVNLRWISETLGRPIETAELKGRWIVQPAVLRWGIAAVVLLSAAGAFLAGRAGRSSPASEQPVHFQIPLTSPIVRTAGQYVDLAISADGRAIVFQEDGGLYMRSLDSVKLVRIVERAASPAFLPDGRLSFIAGRREMAIPLGGGPATEVSPITATDRHWGSDGWIYYSLNLGSSGIWRSRPAGGAAEQVTRVDDAGGENAHMWPDLLPGGKALIFTALGASGGSDDSRVSVQRLGSGKHQTLVDRAMYGRYLANGHLLWATNTGAIYVAPFDLDSLALTGSAQAVLSDVGTATWGGMAFLKISENGAAVFLSRSARPGSVLRIVDPGGIDITPSELRNAEVLAKLGPGWHEPVIAPNGQAIAVTGRKPGASDIFTVNLNTGAVERLTLDTAEDEFPVWSLDSGSVAYTSAQTGETRRIFVKSITAGTAPTLVRAWPRHLHLSSWSLNSRWLAGTDSTPGNGTDVWAISMMGEDPLAIATTAANEGEARFSPDGKWIAYTSDESGRFEIYVVSFPKLDVRRQVSSGGGTSPRWSDKGNTLYYLSQGSLIAQPVNTNTGEFRNDKPVTLPVRASSYDVLPGGRGFVLAEPNPAPVDEQLHVIVDWFSQFPRKKD